MGAGHAALNDRAPSTCRRYQKPRVLRDPPRAGFQLATAIRSRASTRRVVLDLGATASSSASRTTRGARRLRARARLRPAPPDARRDFASTPGKQNGSGGGGRGLTSPDQYGALVFTGSPRGLAALIAVAQASGRPEYRPEGTSSMRIEGRVIIGGQKWRGAPATCSISYRVLMIRERSERELRDRRGRSMSYRGQWLVVMAAVRKSTGSCSGDTQRSADDGQSTR